MNIFGITLLGILIAICIIFFINSSKEGWYPTTTYINSPRTFGTVPFGYYPSYNYYQPQLENNYNLSQLKNNYYQPQLENNYNPPQSNYQRLSNYQPQTQPFYPQLAQSTYAPIPYGNPVPLDTIRWRGMFGPMLTSIKSPKEYAIGQWILAGTAYTDNPNDFTYLNVWQLNLDPGRDLFSYMVQTKDGQRIPININNQYQNGNRLEDGDRFKVQGMEAKGDFIFVEADKYTYVYA